MLYLITGVYYLNIAEDALFSIAVIVIALLGFSITHHLLYSERGDRYLPYLLLSDSIIITVLAFMEPQSELYLILFGVSAVTLFIMEERRSYIISFVSLFFAIWIAHMMYSRQIIGEVSVFDNIVSFSFVVFCAVVGRLIHRLTAAEEKIVSQYKELNYSHDALKDAHSQLKIYSDQVEEMTAMEERNRISREIHDTVGHKMTALLMQIQAAKELQPVAPEKSMATMEICEKLAREALQEVRISVRTLKQESTNQRSFVLRTKELLEEFYQMTGMVTEFHVEGNASSLLPSLQLTMTRMIQEAVTNAVKHGGADYSKVSLSVGEKEAVLVISDNGKGAEHTVGGFGLVNMRERVEDHGGTLHFSSELEMGFEIRGVFPLTQVTWKVGGQE